MSRLFPRSTILSGLAAAIAGGESASVTNESRRRCASAAATPSASPSSIVVGITRALPEASCDAEIDGLASSRLVKPRGTNAPNGTPYTCRSGA